MVHSFDLLEGLRMKYRSKPFEVEAVQFTGEDSFLDICEAFSTPKIRPKFSAKLCHGNVYDEDVLIEGMVAKIGDWIIKDGDTFSVYSDEEFKRKYEACE